MISGATLISTDRLYNSGIDIIASYSHSDAYHQLSYVIVIAMDFSKAFDTVRHVTLLEKMANLDLPDHVLIG